MNRYLNNRNIACELMFDKDKGVDVRLADEFADELDNVKSIMCESLGMSDVEERRMRLQIGITDHSFAVIGGEIDYGPNDENYRIISEALATAVQKRLYEMYGVQYSVNYNADNVEIDEFAGGFMDRFKFDEKGFDRANLENEEKKIISNRHPIQDYADRIKRIVSDYIQYRVDDANEKAFANPNNVAGYRARFGMKEAESYAAAGMRLALDKTARYTDYSSQDIDSIENFKFSPYDKNEFVMDVYFKNGTMLYEFPVEKPGFRAYLTMERGVYAESEPEKKPEKPKTYEQVIIPPSYVLPPEEPKHDGPEILF